MIPVDSVIQLIQIFCLSYNGANISPFTEMNIWYSTIIWYILRNYFDQIWRRIIIHVADTICLVLSYSWSQTDVDKFRTCMKFWTLPCCLSCANAFICPLWYIDHPSRERDWLYRQDSHITNLILLYELLYYSDIRKFNHYVYYNPSS